MNYTIGDCDLSHTRKFPRISDEWAKQIIHDDIDCDGKLDYANMRVWHIPENLYVWRMAVQKDSTGYSKFYDVAPIDIEDILLHNLYDGINDELHHIGYGVRSNVIVIGAIV